MASKLLRARIYGRNLVGGEDKDFSADDVFGLAYAPHNGRYFYRNGVINAMPDSTEQVSIVSGPYEQKPDLPKSALVYRPLSTAANSAMKRGLLAVELGRNGGLDVRILDAYLESAPKAISVATEWRGGKQFTLIICQYNDDIKIIDNLEPVLGMRLPSYTAIVQNEKVSFEGGSLRVLLTQRRRYLPYVLENRTDLASRQKLIVGRLQEVACLERAMAGDESALNG